MRQAKNSHGNPTVDVIGGHHRDTTLKRRLVSGGIYGRYQTVILPLIRLLSTDAGLFCPHESQVCGLLPIRDNLFIQLRHIRNSCSSREENEVKTDQKEE